MNVKIQTMVSSINIVSITALLDTVLTKMAANLPCIADGTRRTHQHFLTVEWEGEGKDYPGAEAAEG